MPSAPPARFVRRIPTFPCCRSEAVPSGAKNGLSRLGSERPPRPTGQIIERDTTRGRVYALRVRAYGRRHLITLGTADDGCTRQRAEHELRYVVATSSAACGRPRAVPRPRHRTPRRSTGSRPSGSRGVVTLLDYSWQLTYHLLPFFHGHQLPEITVAEVDRYRTFKVREGAPSSESINKTITRLGQVLAVAEERDLVTRNPVRVNPRNRKLKTRRRRPVYLDSAEQIRPRAGLVATRTTSARASSTRSSPGPTSCWPSTAPSRSRTA
jgi:hypothetical protein